jgi:hypothetical protein
MALDNKQETAEVPLEFEAVLPKNKNDLSDLSLNELHKKLNDAVENEDYEVAAKIRDEISKRS